MRTVEDRLIDRLEAAQTQEYAKRQRREFGWENFGRADPLSLESVKKIWTVRGPTPFRLRFAGNDTRLLRVAIDLLQRRKPTF